MFLINCQYDIFNKLGLNCVKIRHLKFPECHNLDSIFGQQLSRSNALTSYVCMYLLVYIYLGLL